MLSLRGALATILCLSLGAILGGCKDSSGGSPTPDVQVETLSAAVLDGLDAMPSPRQTLAEILLPNGLTAEEFLAMYSGGTDGISGEIGPQDAKNLLIAKLASAANRLTDRSLWVAEDEGTGKPAQPNGLAYVYGGKRTDLRARSSTGCCPQYYGLDCSGFLAQVFAGGDVSLPGGPASLQRQAGALTARLQANPTYGKLHAEDLAVIPLNDMETGDILYWNDAAGSTQHIGIVFGSLIYQSNGSSAKVEGSCDAVECDKNQGPNRGPRTLPLEQATTFFRQSGLQLGGVVRIVAEISGSWRFSLRCQSASFDVVDAALEFPAGRQSGFRLVEEFLDYNGQPLSGVFDFEYDQIANVLSCTFDISSPNCASNPFRTETFSVRLDRDDTGYLATTELFRNQCANCLAEVRLQNLETSGLPDRVERLLLLLAMPEESQQLGPAGWR